METVEFKCPACDHTGLEEIMEDVTVTSEITSIPVDGDLQYGEQLNNGGEVDRYQCSKCGNVVCTPEDAYAVQDHESLAKELIRRKGGSV